MPYKVTKTYDHTLGLSACFRQWRAESHCRFMHGYALSFVLVFEADRLDENNWVLDFGGLKEVKAFLVETFDHKLIVAEDDPHAELFDTLDGVVANVWGLPFVGCEGFAQHVFDHVNEWLQDVHEHDTQVRGLRLVSVECREHAGNSATYTGE